MIIDSQSSGRTCTKCGMFKLWDLFGPHKNGINGRSPGCRACESSRVMKWHSGHKDTHYPAKNKWRREHRDQINAARQKRRREDPAYKILENSRRRIRKVLRGQRKANKTSKLIGCSRLQFTAWLESKFLPGMSWENYGKWHVDHVRPCASFNLVDPAQQRQCFNYTNLQPLWAMDNILKGDTWQTE
jgi:hypothetical protein